MMIALIILGFGLLVVGAALPVGYRYTQQTVDRATGDAAVEYALDTIEQRVRLSQRPAWYDAASYLHVRPADIFQPRVDQPTAPTLHGTLKKEDGSGRLWEPLVKVRPLLARSINVTPGFQYAQTDAQRDIEVRIDSWLSSVLSPATNPVRLEYEDYTVPLPQTWLAASLPCTCNVYPPIGDGYEGTTGGRGYTVDKFFANKYFPWPADNNSAELRRAVDRQVGWVAFYRRVSYADDADPNFYEFIVVATRLPSSEHRYPMFDTNVAFTTLAARRTGPPLPPAAVPRTGAAAPYGSWDVSVPVPWLVGFQELPPGPTWQYVGAGDRVISDPNWVDPPTLRFLASPEVADLMPPGSVFIPALNDDDPSLLNNGGPTPNPWPNRMAGFVPHAPQVLPIYEVERIEPINSTTTAVIVKNNGFYPWTALGTGADGAALWPVWVVPPAFKQLSSVGCPVYEKRSPVVSVGRRFVHVREVP
jgi:hypothetical protein